MVSPPSKSTCQVDLITRFIVFLLLLLMKIEVDRGIVDTSFVS